MLELLPGRAWQEKREVTLSELHAAYGSRLVVLIEIIRDRHKLILGLKTKCTAKIQNLRAFCKKISNFPVLSTHKYS